MENILVLGDFEDFFCIQESNEQVNGHWDYFGVCLGLVHKILHDPMWPLSTKLPLNVLLGQGFCNACASGATGGTASSRSELVL